MFTSGWSSLTWELKRYVPFDFVDDRQHVGTSLTTFAPHPSLCLLPSLS
jgi:hypothetical protein